MRSNEIDPNNLFYGWVVAKVKTNMNTLKRLGRRAVPMHPLMHDGRLMFCHLLDSQIMCLYTPAIKLEQERQGLYEYEYLYGYKFKPVKVFKKYMNDLFALKKKAKKAKQPARTQAAKITANSGFGWTALKWRNVTGAAVVDDGAPLLLKYLAEGRLLNEAPLGEDLSVLRIRRDIDNSQTCVQIGSAISCLGRMRLFEFLKDMIDEGSNVYYTDTDSAIIDRPLSESKHLYKYIPDYDTDPGASLGSMKNELNDDLPADHGLGKDLGWDQGVFIGAKAYALSYTLPNGKKITKCKLKGFKKTSTQPLTMDMLLKTAENREEIDRLFESRHEINKEHGKGEFFNRAKEAGAIVNNQTTNFAFSRTNMLQTELVVDGNVVDTGWHVRVKKGQRIFRSVYNKAYLHRETGRQLPFIMTSTGPLPFKDVISDYNMLVNT